jgi:hypothetical protein
MTLIQMSVFFVFKWVWVAVYIMHLVIAGPACFLIQLDVAYRAIAICCILYIV